MAGKISIRPWIQWLLIGWFGGWAGGLQAQDRPVQFEFDHLREKDGLSFNLVNCFFQDRDGFLWIGTFDGLNRYDGSQFIQFKHNRADPNSLLHNTVHDLCEDKQGNIWMVVDNGVSCYEKVTGRFRNYTKANGRAIGFCTNILCDRNGDIWFTSRRIGLFRYSTKTDKIQYFPYNPTDNPQTASSFISKNCLLEDPTHKGFWVADATGLHYFDIDRQRFYNHRNNPQHLPVFNDHAISAMALDGDHLIFADNDAQKIIVYSLTTQQILKTITPVSSRPNREVFPIATIFVDRQHNLWVSSWNYLLFHIAANTWQATELVHDETNPTSIAGGFFWAGWQHPDGSVWLGTVNGISHTNPERAFYNVFNVGAQFPALNDKHGIISLLEDADGSWWLGTEMRGLLQYEPQTNRLAIYKLPNATLRYPFGSSINAICAVGGSLYINAETDLFVFNKATKQFSRLPWPDTHKTPIQCNHMVLHGDRLWLFEADKPALCYHVLTQKWEAYPILPNSEVDRFDVRSSLVDHRGQLWLNVYPIGLVRFLPDKKRFIREKTSDDVLMQGNISSHTEDQNGNFWLSSNTQGLFRYDPRRKRSTQWTESEGLAYDHCWAVQPDRLGNVWVGAYNKFSVFSVRKNEFINFTLPYNEANLEYINRHLLLRNGHVLASLKGYLVEFLPEKLVDQSAALPEKILISQVSAGDSIWLNHRGLSQVNLKTDVSGFTVHFGILTSTRQRPFQYLYQLEGYESDWQQAREASYAVYTKMPGGDYTFRVKAIMGDGQQTSVSSLAIHIDTVFYQTAWFWVLMGLVLFMLVGFFYRYRAGQTRALHELQVQATRLERDKTTIQYQNLINHLNPHFLFNSLTSLNSLILTRPKEASVFLRKLSIIYRYILQNKDKELVSLQDELTFTQHYIDLQTTRFGDGLQIGINIPDDQLNAQIVPVTIQNLLENAIKHNSLGDENSLVIRIYTDNNTLYISNNLQKKSFVETSNKQGLTTLQSLYHYLSRQEVKILETPTQFTIAIPLL